MKALDLFEIFLYLFPIGQIVLVHLFFKPYLQYKNRLKVSVTDTVLPILLVGIHILSGRLLSFSLLPHFLFGVFLLGLMITFYLEKSPSNFSTGKIISIILKIMFLLGFITYYAIVIARLVQVVRG